MSIREVKAFFAARGMEDKVLALFLPALPRRFLL